MLASADLLGRAQRLLGGVGVTAQDVAGTGDLEHHGGQPVTHEVVDVAGDPAPLHQQRLLRELAAGGLQLGDQLTLAASRAAEDPQEGDRQDPDAHRDLGRILDHGRGHGRQRGEHEQRHGCRGRRGESPDHEREQRHLEEQRLELPGTLRDDGRDDHRERQRGERHVGQAGPREERRGGEPAEHEIGTG
jgi:hypothetical protein